VHAVCCVLVFSLCSHTYMQAHNTHNTPTQYETHTYIFVKLEICCSLSIVLAGNCTQQHIDIGDVLALRQQLFYTPSTNVS
jgi:hypothetical protein